MCNAIKSSVILEQISYHLLHVWFTDKCNLSKLYELKIKEKCNDTHGMTTQKWDHYKTSSPRA